MPLPYNIHYFRVVDLDTSLDDPKKLFASKKACLLVVLEYRVKSALEISLEGTDYQAVLETTPPRRPRSACTSSPRKIRTPLPISGVIKGFWAAGQSPGLGLLGPGDVESGSTTGFSFSVPSSVLPGTIIAEYATLRGPRFRIHTIGLHQRDRAIFRACRFLPAVGGDVHTCTSLVSRC